MAHEAWAEDLAHKQGTETGYPKLNPLQAKLTVAGGEGGKEAQMCDCVSVNLVRVQAELAAARAERWSKAPRRGEAEDLKQHQDVWYKWVWRCMWGFWKWQGPKSYSELKYVSGPVPYSTKIDEEQHTGSAITSHTQTGDFQSEGSSRQHWRLRIA